LAVFAVKFERESLSPCEVGKPTENKRIVVRVGLGEQPNAVKKTTPDCWAQSKISGKAAPARVVAAIGNPVAEMDDEHLVMRIAGTRANAAAILRALLSHAVVIIDDGSDGNRSIFSMRYVDFPRRVVHQQLQSRLLKPGDDLAVPVHDTDIDNDEAYIEANRAWLIRLAKGRLLSSKARKRGSACRSCGYHLKGATGWSASTNLP
jgi:hypothetical protein